jgi:hypothetical protein
MRVFFGLRMGCLGWAVLGPLVISAWLCYWAVIAAGLLLFVLGLLAWRAVRRQPLLQHRGWFRGPLGRAL